MPHISWKLEGWGTMLMQAYWQYAVYKLNAPIRLARFSSLKLDYKHLKFEQLMHARSAWQHCPLHCLINSQRTGGIGYVNYKKKSSWEGGMEVKKARRWIWKLLVIVLSSGLGHQKPNTTSKFSLEVQWYSQVKQGMHFKGECGEMQCNGYQVNTNVPSWTNSGRMKFAGETKVSWNAARRCGDLRFLRGLAGITCKFHRKTRNDPLSTQIWLHEAIPQKFGRLRTNPAHILTPNFPSNWMQSQKTFFCLHTKTHNALFTA